MRGPSAVQDLSVDYPSLKFLHQLLVGLSVLGFAARAGGRLAAAPWTRSPVARTVPHVVDTLLLLTGVAMLWLLRTSPHQLPWLVAKLAGLVAYIALGVVALRDGVAKPMRWLAGLLALCTVAWMVSVARTKHPLGALAAWF
jgi:uncharacterized membrane protein SirB2